MDRFSDAMLRQEAAASAKLDGETWSLPRFRPDQEVWATGCPAIIVNCLQDVECGAHPGEYSYGVRFCGTGENWNAWPYCESQLTER